MKEKMPRDTTNDTNKQPKIYITFRNDVFLYCCDVLSPLYLFFFVFGLCEVNCEFLSTHRCEEFEKVTIYLWIHLIFWRHFTFNILIFSSSSNNSGSSNGSSSKNKWYPFVNGCSTVHAQTRYVYNIYSGLIGSGMVPLNGICQTREKIHHHHQQEDIHIDWHEYWKLCVPAIFRVLFLNNFFVISVLPSSEYKCLLLFPSISVQISPRLYR